MSIQNVIINDLDIRIFRTSNHNFIFYGNDLWFIIKYLKSQFINGHGAKHPCYSMLKSLNCNKQYFLPKFVFLQMTKMFFPISFVGHESFDAIAIVANNDPYAGSKKFNVYILLKSSILILNQKMQTSIM